MSDPYKCYDNIFKKMTTEKKSFFCPMDKNIFSLILDGVLVNVLVCADFSSKLSHGTLRL